MAFNSPTSQDKALKGYRFSVEVSGGGDAKKQDNQWTALPTPPGGAIEATETPTGEDAYGMSTAGARVNKEFTLQGPVTPSRGEVFKWFKDLLFKGGASEGFRDITINYFGPRGDTPLRSTSMEDCMVTAYEIGPFQAESNEVLFESVTIYPNLYRAPLKA